MAANTPRLLKQITSELRQSVASGNLKDNATYQYILNQYRKFQTTDEQLCRAREEMSFIANTYLTYLRSSRLRNQICDEFHGKGERTVAETAKLVGFKLPHDPK